MKFIPLVWAGIRRKPGRSILIFLQVIIAFALFGMLQGLASGINYAIASAHADRLYVESKLDPGYPLPIAMVKWLKTVPGVVAVTPWFGFGASYQRPENGINGLATDVDTFLSIYPEYRVDPAQQRAMGQIQDGAIVGIGTMHKYGWKVGQRVTLQLPSRFKRTDGTNDWTFDILGTWVDSEGLNEDDSQRLITHYRCLNGPRVTAGQPMRIGPRSPCARTRTSGTPTARGNAAGPHLGRLPSAPEKRTCRTGEMGM